MPAEDNNREVGRPKIELSLLWDGWHIDIIDLYKVGASDVEIKALIAEKTDGKVRCSNDLWTRWMKEEEEFSETVKYGKLLSEAWWQRSGRVNIEEPKFNSTLWYMNMKNRFGWKDKQEVEQTGNLTIEVLKFTDDEENENG
ncbi:hypothetical protein KAR91_41930 [Candidatus Pacearchaeota archaeon]|nr:hypothetical protein [Candidatus Pacearchaeota archaeon]